MQRLVECVPNFSEGRDKRIIDAIATAVRAVDGVDLLNVDPGADTNRTVFTFVGSPEVVLEGAFQAIQTASRLIDMTRHKGAHPRLGATDVCPFVPVSGVTMEECVEISRKLGERIGTELGIPVYLYEFAATSPQRKNLATIREGEYEGLPAKITLPEWIPDFGPALFNARSGAIVIGARKFLIAYNINLNTRSKKLAHQIALDIRERGRFVRDESGKFVLDEHGQKISKPGLLKECKAVGWFIETYDKAQVSINLTDFETTPPHDAFDTCVEVAQNYGVRVTGSEIVGLVPLAALRMAGYHYLQQQGQSTGVPERMLVATAVQSLGLSELTPFDIDERVIEYRVGGNRRKLVDLTCRRFADELSTDSPAPGGGSVAALCGALGAALAAMVGNLTVGKKGYQDVTSEMIRVADHGQLLKDQFLADVDRDTDAFNNLMACFGMPKKAPEQQSVRNAAIQEATKNATLIPFGVLERCIPVLDLALNVAQHGNQNSLSDAGVSVLAASTAGEGAFLNVRINLRAITDESFAQSIQNQADSLILTLRTRVKQALQEVHNRLEIHLPTE